MGPASCSPFTGKSSSPVQSVLAPTQSTHFERDDATSSLQLRTSAAGFPGSRQDLVDQHRRGKETGCQQALEDRGDIGDDPFLLGGQQETKGTGHRHAESLRESSARKLVDQENARTEFEREGDRLLFALPQRRGVEARIDRLGKWSFDDPGRHPNGGSDLASDGERDQEAVEQGLQVIEQPDLVQGDQRSGVGDDRLTELGHRLASKGLE
jgi:hypothetical protein